MYCKYCGNEIEDNSSFCSKCENSLNIEKEKDITESKIEDNPTSETVREYKGLEGWLTLVILGLFITLVRVGYEFLTLFSGDTDYSGVGGLLLYDILTLGGLTVLIIYIIYLFFKKSKKFPKFYIVFLIIMMIINIVTLFSILPYDLDAGVLGEYYENVGRSTLGAIIWGLYTIKSKRVKSTFVE